MNKKYLVQEDPVVAKNPFLHRQDDGARIEIPPFSAIKSRLPVPVLPDFPLWQTLYWQSWEQVWALARPPKKEANQIAAYIDSTYNQNVQMWDTVFMSQYATYGRRAFNLAAGLDNFYARQHAKGFICREFGMESGEDFFHPFDPNSTGPNILAWGEWRLFRQTGDGERLRQIFWPLVAYHRWCRANRTWQNGLYWTTGMSSAMDNQPRVPDSNAHHRHWSWVDATMQAVVSCDLIEQMAIFLEEKALAIEFTEEKTALISKINEIMWSKKNEFYLDVDANGRFSHVKTVGAFWGLFDDTLIPLKRRLAFVQHLRDSWSFNVHHPVPTQSSDSVGYNGETGNYWRGAVWPCTTYMVLKGLRQINQHKLVHDIARRHLDIMAKVYKQTETVWENYSPEYPAPGSPSKPDFWGMSALTPIAILLEDVIGIHVDWPQSRVYWDKRLECDSMVGVENYPIGENGTMKLVGNRSRVLVETDTPFTLVIRDATLNMQTAVSSGKAEFDLT